MSSLALTPNSELQQWVEKELIERLRSVVASEGTATFVVETLERCCDQPSQAGGDETPWTRFKRLKCELMEKLAICFKDGDGVDSFVHCLLTKTIGQTGSSPQQREDCQGERAPIETPEDGELKSPVTKRARSPTELAYIASPEREFLGYFGRGADEPEGSNRGGLFTAVEWKGPETNPTPPAPLSNQPVWSAQSRFPEHRNIPRQPMVYNRGPLIRHQAPPPSSRFAVPRQQFPYTQPVQQQISRMDLTRPPPRLNFLGSGGGSTLRFPIRAPHRPPLVRLPAAPIARAPVPALSSRISCDQDEKKKQLLGRVHKRTQLYGQLKIERDEMRRKASKSDEGSERKERFLQTASRLDREMRKVNDEINRLEGHVKDIDKVRTKDR